MMNQFKRLYNFYFRVSAIIFGKQSNASIRRHHLSRKAFQALVAASLDAAH
jgi:hypothetical protein